MIECAVNDYRSILFLDSENETARDGLWQIINIYAENGDQEYDQENWREAAIQYAMIVKTGYEWEELFYTIKYMH